MDDFEISTPVYLVDGILESGKTSFLNFTRRQDYFQVEGTTLLINCEEGEEEYDEKDLLKVSRALLERHAKTKREWYQIVHTLLYLSGSDEHLIWEKIIANGNDTWLRDGGEG